MKSNNFIFADVSTYNKADAKQFYASVFGWSFHEDSGYNVAHLNGKEICGLYETPQKFKEMNMPSFWMSYIQVNSIATTVTKAKALGGIIELVEDSAIGKVALIRDPLGAGFTIYEGNKLNSRFSDVENSLVWNELFISNLSKVKPFYEAIFNWTIEATENNRYFVKNTKTEIIGAIQEISNNIKGDKEYWSVYFGVKNINATKELAIKNGGKLLYEDKSMAVIEDIFGAFFHIIPIDKTETKSRNRFIGNQF